MRSWQQSQPACSLSCLTSFTPHPLLPCSYRAKKLRRSFQKKVRYECRKVRAATIHCCYYIYLVCSVHSAAVFGCALLLYYLVSSVHSAAVFGCALFLPEGCPPQVPQGEPGAASL